MRCPVFLLEDDSDDEDEGDVHVKNVLVVGKKRSGKTSVITRLVRSSFTLCYTPTKSIEIYPPTLIGKQYYKFYEIPYSYTFDHRWYIAAHAVFIVEDIDTEFWAQLMNTVDPKHPMEVYFITQKKDLKILHRQYHLNALEFSGFSELMFHVSQS